MPRNLSPSVLAAIDAPQKSMALFLELNFENAATGGPPPPPPPPGIAITYLTMQFYAMGAGQLVVNLSGALPAWAVVGGAAFLEGTSHSELNGVTAPILATGSDFLGAYIILGPFSEPPFSLFSGELDSGSIVQAAGGPPPPPPPPGTTYDMLEWMLMSPALAAANHFASTELDGVTPANHLYTQLGAGNYYWIKGDGYPWDINIFDNNLIYLSTTENGWTSASMGKRFESLNAAIGLKGVPFAKRFMSIDDSVFSTDTRLAIYTACGVATYTSIGAAKCTLAGPFVETIPGAGSTLPANITTIHLQYEWGLDASYNHKAGSTMETFTLSQPYGLVRWQTQAWNMGTGSYDPPNNATNYNILTPGVSGLPFSDPCPFGANGGGSSTPAAGVVVAGGVVQLQSEIESSTALWLWSGIGNMSSQGPAWDPGATFPYGQIFTGMGWLGRIESVPQNSELTAENITLQLSGIPVELLGDVVNTVRLSGTATLWLGFFSSTGQLLADPLALWDGALDVPTVTDGADTCTISITVENALLSLNLSSNRRFTTLDQQLDFPGDTGFDYVSAMQDLFLPYPCGILSTVNLYTGVSQAPDTTNALTVSPVGPLKLTVGGPPLQVTGAAYFVSGPYNLTTQPVTSAGLWSSSDTGVAIVTNGSGANAALGFGIWGSGGGLITATGPGNCTITFFFGQVSCSITVTVLPA